MKQKILLNDYSDHPYRDTINNLGIAQFDLANSLNIHQSRLSKMLRGIDPMPDKIENKIHEILDGLQQPKEPAKKRKKIIRPAKA